MAMISDSGSTRLTWNTVPTGLAVGDTVYNVFEPVHVSDIPYVPDDPTTFEREDSLGIAQQRSNLNAVSLPFLDPDQRALFGIFLIAPDTGVIPPDTGAIRFNKHHEVRDGDEVEIRLDSLITGDVTVARGDVALINVFPNPYYGLNLEESSAAERFVTFNHLPADAVIRIYNLAGIHVRRLVKNDPTTQFFRWDLRNEHNAPVASGIYLVYMELKDAYGTDLGRKTLKLVVIQEDR
jgi:hypothetical protein